MLSVRSYTGRARVRNIRQTFIHTRKTTSVGSGSSILSRDVSFNSRRGVYIFDVDSRGGCIGGSRRETMDDIISSLRGVIIVSRFVSLRATV